jgi:murein DD-endopeptidase MepM/ murein hydrolase activator NlpD
MRAKEFLSEAINKDVIRMQRELKAAGADLGTYGPAKDGIDGRMGPKTLAAMQKFPAIASKFKSVVANVPHASDAEVAQADHGVRVGQNPNIDNATRARAQASVQDLDNTDSTQIRPVDGRVTSPFGHRNAPTAGASSNHLGVDLASATGTPVRSPISGKVVYASMDDNNCGGTIAILSNKKVKHRFCHCSKIDVVVGQHVEQGEVVGLTGGGKNDPGHGTSTGPHLHWEKQVAGRLVDPMANIG